jgi:hypothetical protein
MAMSFAMEWAMVSAMTDQPGKPTFRQLQDHVEQQRFVMRSQMSQWVLAHAALESIGASRAPETRCLKIRALRSRCP